MKRKTLILTIVCILVTSLFSGCNENDDINDNNENLNFDDKKETVVVKENPYDNLNENPQLEIERLNPELSLEEALKENEDPEQDLSIFNTRNIVFDGTDFKYRIYVQNKSEIPMTQTIFMEANNNLQPFTVQGCEEKKYYTYTINPGEGKDIFITFSPIYAPADRKGTTMLYSITHVAATEELENFMIQNPTKYTAGYINYVRVVTNEFGIKADSKKNERLVKSRKNEMGKDSPYIFKADSGKEESNTSAGLTLGEPFEKEKIDGLINFKVEWDGNTPLYSRNLCYGENNIRVFLISDGELLPAFNGEYFADYYQKTGVIHNIELDNAVLPKEGNHLVYGVMMYKNNETGMMEDIEVNYPLLLMVQ